MEKLKPVTRTAKALAVATGVGLLASGDSGPVDNNQDTQSQALNARPGYIQAGESLATKSLEEAIETRLNAMAGKAEAQSPVRRMVVLPIIARPQINSNLQGSTPVPTPNATETPIVEPKPSLQEFLTRAREVAHYPYEFNGQTYDFYFKQDPQATYEFNFLNDPQLREQALRFFAEDGERNGFKNFYVTGSSTRNRAPAGIELYPARYNGDSVGYFGGKKENVDGKDAMILIYNPPEEGMKGSDAFRTGLHGNLSSVTASLNVTGHIAQERPAPATQDQLNRMSAERQVLFPLYQSSY